MNEEEIRAHLEKNESVEVLDYFIVSSSFVSCDEGKTPLAGVDAALDWIKESGAGPEDVVPEWPDEANGIVL